MKGRWAPCLRSYWSVALLYFYLNRVCFDYVMERCPNRYHSGTSAFPLHSLKATSVCDLPLLELYWFHALRQPLGSGVSPSTDLPSGTVSHQHYVRQICRRIPSSGHWWRISSHPSSDTESLRDFAAAYKSADLLTYLHSYYRRRLGNRTQAFEWHQFQWPQVTSNPDFKATVLFNV